MRFGCAGSRGPGSRYPKPCRAHRPKGWCTMMRAFGSAIRMPGSPAAKRKLPIEAAWPMHTVETRGLIFAAGVADRRVGRHHATGRVDVHVDGLAGVLAFEKQQLRGDQRCHAIFDLPGDEDDAFTQQTAENIEAAFAAAGLLNDHRHQRTGNGSWGELALGAGIATNRSIMKIPLSWSIGCLCRHVVRCSRVLTSKAADMSTTGDFGPVSPQQCPSPTEGLPVGIRLSAPERYRSRANWRNRLQA